MSFGLASSGPLRATILESLPANRQAVRQPGAGGPWSHLRRAFL